MEERTDAELVALARSGDKDALGQLIERHQGMAQHVALGRVANSEVALRLAQEAMLQAYLSLDHPREGDRFRSWLYGIVLNVCRSHIRGQTMLVYSLGALEDSSQIETGRLPGADPPPQAAAEEQELRSEILAAVQSLPPRSRAAALLFYYEHLSVQEIAVALGVSASAVKGRLRRARKQLRQPRWPVYLEMAPVERSRRKTMTTDTLCRAVTIANIIERGDSHQRIHGLMMLDEAGRRVLPLWISHIEGTRSCCVFWNAMFPDP